MLLCKCVTLLLLFSLSIWSVVVSVTVWDEVEKCRNDNFVDLLVNESGAIAYGDAELSKLEHLVDNNKRDLNRLYEKMLRENIAWKKCVDWMINSPLSLPPVLDCIGLMRRTGFREMRFMWSLSAYGKVLWDTQMITESIENDIMHIVSRYSNIMAERLHDVERRLNDWIFVCTCLLVCTSFLLLVLMVVKHFVVVWIKRVVLFIELQFLLIVSACALNLVFGEYVTVELQNLHVLEVCERPRLYLGWVMIALTSVLIFVVVE